ncbi:MAG: dehypoxanthine futalosine cyclase, partial [Bacteroidia bacterium]|nr:dehypoxanthine futalosine cyclase [Bacteroidia bacterium]
MTSQNLLDKALAEEFLSVEEGCFLYEHAGTDELMLTAHTLRKKKKPDNVVTWIIDRNLNTTNVCIANCKFCNFYRIPGHKESYITTTDQYKTKIDETIKYGGDQLLLQGGHHPDLGLSFYTETFSEIKSLYP